MFIGLLSQRRKRKILTLKYILVVSWMEGNAIVREKISVKYVGKATVLVFLF